MLSLKVSYVLVFVLTIKAMYV